MSLPNGTVKMEAGMCSICGPGSKAPVLGVTCECGKHFHVGGPEVFEKPGPLFCPRCEGACLPTDITGNKEINEGLSEEQLIDLVCTEVEPEVAAEIRNIAKTRKSRDPNYWLNVCLRESWRHDNGNYEGWDKTARASGHNPTKFGPAHEAPKG